MEDQVLVVLGADGQLVLRRVEDVEQQVTLTGAEEGHRKLATPSSQQIAAHHLRGGVALISWDRSVCVVICHACEPERSLQTAGCQAPHPVWLRPPGVQPERQTDSEGGALNPATCFMHEAAIPFQTRADEA